MGDLGVVAVVNCGGVCSVMVVSTWICNVICGKRSGSCVTIGSGEEATLVIAIVVAVT